MTEDTKTTAPASDDVVLAKLEEAVQAKAESEAAPDASKDVSDESAPEPQYGEAFQELAEKKGFKSVDDLVRSYQNLESHTTRIEQDRKKLIESVKQVAPTKEQSEELPPEQRQALDMLKGVVKEVVDESLGPVKETFDQQRVKEEISEIQTRYPDFKGYALETALRYAMDNPGVSLEDAYKLTSFDSVATVGRTQEAQAAKAKEKSRAFTESAKTAKGEGVDYSKLSLEEMEQILPKAGQYIDHRGKLRRD